MSYDHEDRSRKAPVHPVGSRTASGTPGKATLTDKLQRKAAGPATAVERGGPSGAWAQATSGRAGEVPYRADMERSFGRPFGGVNAYLGGDGAQAGLGALGAHAAAQGNSVAFRDPNPSKGLVAHELAHVVQQSRGPSGVQAKSVGAAGGSAEQRADAAAEAVMRGQPVPDVGTADSDVIQCAVDTYGGTWDTTELAAVNSGAGVGKTVGGHIHLTFNPTELVEAPSIGLTQTVRTVNSSTAGGAVDQPSLISANKRTMATPDGTAIDQGDGSNTANTNPLYAVENPAPPDAPSATLTDVGTDAGFGAHGHRIRNPDGTFDTKLAELDDTAQRSIEFAGQEWNAKFEVAALVLEGPMANTYLGTVRWGWKADAAGVATMDPAALEVVSMGAPTAGFMASAQRWNDHQVEDSAGNKFDTVDLPISTHHGVDPASLDDRALLQRIRELADQLMSMDRRSVDYQQVRFESRGLAQEAVRRGAAAADSGHTLRAGGGDSLWQIAERELGSGVKWTQIFALNRAEILDPNRIAAGQELKMPVPFRPAGP